MAVVAFAFIFWTVSEFAIIVPGLIAGLICIAAPITFGVSDPRTVRGRTIAAACAPMTGLVILSTLGVAVPLVLAGHAAFAATVGYALPNLRQRSTGVAPNPAMGAVLGLPAGALMLASWLVMGDGASATAIAMIVAPSVIAGSVGGLAWSANANENTRLATLLGLVGVTVVTAAVLGTGAPL